MSWWQHLPEKMSPTIFTLGSFQLRWYGMMYVVAFTVTYYLVMYRYRTEGITIKKEAVQNWFAYAVLGVLAGGRLGYVLFYEPAMILQNPLGIVLPFDMSHGFRFTGLAGMSFHGGVIGVALCTLLFCKKNRINFWQLADVVVPAIPLAYTFGRLGNFINGELYGRVTDKPWGMYFPADPSGQLRHPSQLYEAFFEGIFLFIILWMPTPYGMKDVGTEYRIGPKAVVNYITESLFHKKSADAEQWELICAQVMEPTLLRFDSFDPFWILMASMISTAAGGVLITKSNDLSL